jgi:hypothetical protein
MNRTRLGLALLSLAVFAPASPAQTTTPAALAASTTSTDVIQPQPTVKKERVISKDLSSALAVGYKYQPPPPPKPEAEDVDLRDVDKPRNGIIRLPKYVVESQRPPIFNDRNLYSKEMLRRLAYQKYMSSFSKNLLNRFHLLGRGDEAYALMQYEADERKRNMAEMDDKISMYRVSGDDTEAEKLKDDTQRTFMRRSEGTSSGANNGQ